MSIRYLSENDIYKLYSINESVYLKDKSKSDNLCDYENSDLYLTSVYGDPDSALISFDGTFICVAGCGISIYFIESKKCIQLFNEPEEIIWTEGVYQSAEDGQHYVRFNANTETEKFRIYRLNVKTSGLEILS
ncbi:hypothetical protein [Marinicella gelatinilytica]|uniref:hypothetical protein n=1 Tax=Marinicella gelatinilytica TaxID=2996017 RepID=UPI002260F39C|nr:hypothetical protein [Marinicella gelatinilytica]MCX7545210.1 hypothetical protein [Marinicella gelatinilytica]